MKAIFEVKGLGKCLVGTYALRHLTKHFACNSAALLYMAAEPGMSLEFTVHLLKYAYENALIQEHGAAGLKDKPVEEIDLVVDMLDNETDSDTYTKMYDALWISVVGMTSKEYEEKNKEIEQDVEPEKPKKKKPGSSTGSM